MVTNRLTHWLLSIIAVCLVVLCVRSLLAPEHVVYGASDQLQFTADKDRLYFYDPYAQKVYSYATSGGHVQSVLKLTAPGGELKPAPTY